LLHYDNIYSEENSRDMRIPSKLLFTEDE